MMIGESFVGSGANAAHLNVIAGARDGPVGAAWANALSSPTAGHLPFMVVLQPGVPVKPATVFINKAALRGESHERMTWGPAQAGVAKGVQERMLDGTLPAGAADGWCVIVAAWVDWSADDADAVFENNYRAAREAIERAMGNEPTLDAVREAAAHPHNPFYTPED